MARTSVSMDKGKGKAAMPGAIRSRRGCLVCRRRHKKCDEQFTDGSCERCRTAGLECLLPSSEHRKRYSGPTYKPSSRPRATASLSSKSPPADDGPSSEAGPSDAHTIDPALLDAAVAHLPLISSSTSPPTALTRVPSDCPPSPSWDPFAFGDIPSSSSVSHPPPSPATLLQNWFGRSAASGSPPSDFLRSFDAFIDRFNSPLTFTSASLRDATTALTSKYMSPDTELIQNCYHIIHSTWLNHPRAPEWFSQTAKKTGTSKLARDLVVKVFEELMPAGQGEMGEGGSELVLSSHLYAQAVDRLVECNEMPLEDRLHIISDLQLYGFASSGARQAYAAIALADRYFASLGDEVYLAGYMRRKVVDPQDLSFRLYVAIDICRALSFPDSRPMLPRLELYDTAAENAAAHVVVFPYEIAVVLSHICHLPSSLAPADSLSATAALEMDLLLIDEDSFDRPWTVRIWKLCARALLYQRVRRVGPLHPVLQGIAADLGRAFARSGPASSAMEKSLALPLFIAGTLAVGQAERELVRALWATLRPERGWAEPIALLHRIWGEMDETGDTVRWDEVVRKEGWSVCFF